MPATVWPTQNQGTVGAFPTLAGTLRNPQKSPICWQRAGDGFEFGPGSIWNMHRPPPTNWSDRETEDFHVRSRVQQMWQKLSQFPITFFPFGFSARSSFQTGGTRIMVRKLFGAVRSLPGHKFINTHQINLTWHMKSIRDVGIHSWWFFFKVQPKDVELWLHRRKKSEFKATKIAKNNTRKL